MKFKWEFYFYQYQILEVFHKELARGDNKIHIVSPPWSWKTIIGLEIMNQLFIRRKGVSLILVPNITLQYQWKDKLEKFFLESGENVDNLVSLQLWEIKKVNILTYQIVSQTKSGKSLDELIFELRWKKENVKIEDIIQLKEDNINLFLEKFNFYKKYLKSTESIENLLSNKVITYINKLKTVGVSSIILDEAHHLQSWWSKVVFYIYKSLHNPYIVGLTATPPFYDPDYFVLDENYKNLLWEVDYYLPTPAIVKSGKLSPYVDLVYFVLPDENVISKIKSKKQIIEKFIDANKEDLKKFFNQLLLTNLKNLHINSIYRFLTQYLDFNINVDDEICYIDDIAYSLSFYMRKYKWKLKDIKDVFYQLWYVRKQNKFQKYFLFQDKIFVYNPKKVEAIKKILEVEIDNLGDNLRLVIITDFLDDIDGLLDCKYILKQLADYKYLNPTLVSGQWIWQLDKNNSLKLLRDENVLSITEKFDKWEIKVLIWTTSILWEWWDSEKVNVLIDVSWTKAYMTVNQVRWRALRLDKQNHKKVANIYDIVTIDPNNFIKKDIDRLLKKHENLYWVDDSWTIVKGVSHIYPNLMQHLHEYENINKNMLWRSKQKEYFYKLWRVWEKFENKETFALTLEINPMYKFYFFKNRLSFYRHFDRKYKQVLWLLESVYISELWKITDYDKDMEYFINKLILPVSNILNYKGLDIKVKALWGGVFRVFVEHEDDLVVKKVTEIISKMFKKVYDEKYVLFVDLPYFKSWEFVTNCWKICRNKAKLEIENICVFPLPNFLSSNSLLRKQWRNIFKRNILRIPSVDIDLIKFKNKFLVTYNPVYLILILFYIILYFLYPWERIKYFYYTNVFKNNYKGYIPFIIWKLEKVWK